ncbi:MAG TPA: Asp-tRNA(Asn)/Glu-tRNA(Gln) amidotransferase subunit GatC, partial [Clostridiales bacterium]|nr:Asp-tRNA(Asn)/Glu-tRNA(Gln) amidotransferase subunit GatC [Clostridiales bacterium]
FFGGIYMKISKEIVREMADISRIKLTSQQENKLQEELQELVGFLEVLNELDTENTQPLTHLFQISSVMREDRIFPSYDRTALLKDTPEHTDETIVVPKTVE